MVPVLCPLHNVKDCQIRQASWSNQPITIIR